MSLFDMNQENKKHNHQQANEIFNLHLQVLLKQFQEDTISLHTVGLKL